MRLRSRLFRKILLVLWAGMVMPFAATFFLLYLIGYQLGDGAAPVLPVPLIPAVPLITGAIAMVIVGLAIAWYLSRPLKELRWALRQVSRGRFDTRVQPRMGSRSDEITDLAYEFDNMAARLQQVTDSRTLLLHDISHELRSPLTRMQAAIGLLRQAPVRMPEMLMRIEGEAERLDELIGELLTLHRIEAGVPGSRERVDLIELLQAIAEDADFEAEASSKSVRIDAPGSFVAEVNGQLVYRAFENVIRNAVKFSLEGGVVDIRASISADGWLICTVEDSGPGVPASMLQAIFEPFARADTFHQKPGVGLGLAIAKRAIEAHGGSISAEQRLEQGLAVRMALPATYDPFEGDSTYLAGTTLELPLGNRA